MQHPKAASGEKLRPIFLESLLFFHPSELTEQGPIGPALPLGEQVALASGRVYVKCCRTKLMKQVLSKLWSPPPPDTNWVLPGHAKLLQRKQDPLWMSYSLTKACKEIRC